MDFKFPTSLSSPSPIPAFEAHLNLQDEQDLSLGMPFDESNDNTNIQYAAGGVRSSPLASTCPSVSTHIDQLRALLSTYLSAEVNAGRGFLLPDPDSPFNTGSQGSELSSSSSSSPPSSIPSPLCEELSLPDASPGLLFHDLSMNDQDVLQAYEYQGEYPLDPSFLGNGQPSPKQPFIQPVALPEGPSISNVPILTDQSVGINNAGACPEPNSLHAVPSISETALGLFFENTLQNPQISPLSIEVDASILSDVPPAPPTTELRKVRAVAPTARTKRIRSGRPYTDATTAAATADIITASVDGMLKCSVCGFSQSTQRKGDFLRHTRTHIDAKLTRFVCCGIPAAHPAAAAVVPGRPVRLYKGREFVGGCGKSYSRMDALQRHLGKSGCASGSTKDHLTWRQLYYL